MSTTGSEHDDRWDGNEDGRALLGQGEKSQHIFGCKDCQTRPWMLRTVRSTILAMLFNTLISVLFTALVVTWSSGHFSASGNIHGLLKGTEITTTFMPETLWNPSSPNAESDAAWAAIPVGGYVLIDDPRNKNLPVSHAHLGGELYAVAGYHQLHCLSMIRNAWFLVLQNGVEALKAPKTFPNHPANQPLEPDVEDCFDYLHQTLRCNADSTLEPFLDSDGMTLRKDGSSGWGVQHVCRDFNQLVDWVDEHDALKFGWFGD